ncbi:trehalase-like isoform X2 [Diorhabda carinulata]|uniref:trehalase-like isoform X2 n=1 Tax=Diorhabda carinulata TaxID=1163345 RepID=UPI0025A12CD9|nr:trehalase-like isoform X2 [Diorhabda carinulata]
MLLCFIFISVFIIFFFSSEMPLNMKIIFTLVATLFGCQNGWTAILTELCSSQVYCQGSLLDKIQSARIFSDSKTFVDLVQKNPENITLKNFEELLANTNNDPNKDEITQFVKDNFIPEGELVPWIPSDFEENPRFLNYITNPEVKDFAKKLYNIWPKLAKKMNNLKNPRQHSLIPIPNGFIIPGGRFKEIYYWDSYWIVKGLLITGMQTTAKGMLENLLFLVRRYGFVPNGSRVYYLNRSQPPLLSLLVGVYLDATNDTAFLKTHVDTLEQELNWWLENRFVYVQKGKTKHEFVQYAVKYQTPRPESYAEDINTCSSFTDKAQCYRDLRSAAESGWDFSTRWFKDQDGNRTTQLTNIATTKIVPVDLNSFMCAAFGQLSRFYKILNNETKNLEYNQKEMTWRNSIQEVFYNFSDGIWYDWDLETSKHRKGFYPSNFAPLWAKSYNISQRDSYGSKAVEYLISLKADTYPGGVPTSLIESSQQWDLPNVWPPLQEMVVLGLDYTDNKEAKLVAHSIANKILKTFMVGMNKTGEMFEKYDAVTLGRYGGGGEYTVQSGFGWSNGVAFSMIQRLFMKQ